MQATCTTEDCMNNGVPIQVPDTMYTFDENGDVSGQRPTAAGDVYCGPCGQPITDLAVDRKN